MFDQQMARAAAAIAGIPHLAKNEPLRRLPPRLLPPPPPPGLGRDRPTDRQRVSRKVSGFFIVGGVALDRRVWRRARGGGTGGQGRAADGKKRGRGGDGV